MSSASSVPIQGDLALFPPIATPLPGVWRTGLVAVLAWGVAAGVTLALPDIDDFERTTLVLLA